MLKINPLIKRAWRESREFNKIASVPLAILFSHAIESGRSHTLIRLKSLIGNQLLPEISHYYFAHAYYLHGEYELARSCLEKLLSKHPYHADATYLLCDIDNLQGQKEAAWQKMISLATQNRRLKTWLVLANLVENEQDFSRLYNTWLQAIKKYGLEPYHLEVNGYIATGALRAGLYDKAEHLWREMIDQITIRKKIPRNKPARNNFSEKSGTKALLDLKKIFDHHEINFFLVSGTLLGCIREGKLLAHDKDADVGVWDDNDPLHIEKIIRKSGYFYIQASRSPHLIRAKHVNGTAIDIFFHYREANDYWHGGVKLKWSNTPFTLIPYPFLGETFNIPENYDLYLKENYGEWRIPQTKFDSSTDTTNATIINTAEFTVSIYRKLAEAILNDSDATVNECLSHLSKIKSEHLLKSKK